MTRDIAVAFGAGFILAIGVVTLPVALIAADDARRSEAARHAGRHAAFLDHLPGCPAGTDIGSRCTEIHTFCRQQCVYACAADGSWHYTVQGKR